MRSCLIASCAASLLLLCAGSMHAQEIVHALSGTVVSVDAQAKTLRITTNDGSEGVFTFAPKGADLDFDRGMQERTTPVASFNKPKDQVVVFFYGNGDTRTAVAVQDLGTGPLDDVEGTVTAFDKHKRTLSLKTASGHTQTFQLDPKASADTVQGATPGDRFQPEKGDNVRVIAQKGAGTEDALFVRD